MEDEEALETGALVSTLANLVLNIINHLLPDRVVTSSVVVGCIFLARDQLLGVEQLAVGASANLIYRASYFLLSAGGLICKN